MNQAIDQYLQIGCGRCPRGGTPACTTASGFVELLMTQITQIRSFIDKCIKDLHYLCNL